MKKVLILMAVAALVSPVMAAYTVYLPAGYGPYQAGSGGEFSLKPTGWNPFPYYAAVAEVTIDNAQYFQTFCLEKLETISAPGTYDVVISKAAVLGGTTNSSDPLSVGTAYLYHEFQKGTLEGYDYGVNRLVSAEDLQKTIWYLEGEQGAVSNTFTALLLTQFGTIANAMLDNNGQYAVAVMNITQNGERKQDMLVCVPAPGALLLGSLGMGLVGWLRRRQAV